MNDNFQTRESTWVGLLPESAHPWKIIAVGDVVYFHNPDHPAHAVIDGRLVVAEFLYTGVQSRFVDAKTGQIVGFK